MKKDTTWRSAVERTMLIAGACLIAGLLSIAPSQAGTTDFGVRTGGYPEEDEAFLGAEVLFGMTDDKRWFGNPNVEHVFIDEGDMTTFSFDVHYDFPSGAPYTVWVGAGPTLIHRDQNLPEDDDSMDAGANVLVGIGAKKGDARPYGQLKMIVADNTEAVVGFGVRF